MPSFIHSFIHSIAYGTLNQFKGAADLLLLLLLPHWPCYCYCLTGLATATASLALLLLLPLRPCYCYGLIKKGGLWLLRQQGRAFTCGAGSVTNTHVHVRVHVHTPSSR